MGMTNALKLLQGVWFPTHLSFDGGPPQVRTPTFPESRDAPFMTIIGEYFYVTTNAEYYWAGGRLLLTENPSRMEFAQPCMTEDLRSTPADYVLAGDELLLCSQKTSRPFDTEYTTRYLRVAPCPTPEMLAFFESIMKWSMWVNWDWESRTYKLPESRG